MSRIFTSNRRSICHEQRTSCLTSRNIRTVRCANEAFGNDTSLIIVRPGRSCCNLFWFTIPDGFYALVTQHGAIVDYEEGNPVWPPGLHYGPPWLKVSHLVTKQAILFNTPIRGCKTRDNVTVQIDISIVLRIMGDKNVPGDDPKNIPKFVHEVTPLGLQQQLADAMAEGIRTLSRSVTHTEVFGLRTVSEEEMKAVQEELYSFAISPIAPPPTPPRCYGTMSPAMPFKSILGDYSTPPFHFHQENAEIESIQEEEKSADQEEEKDLLGEHDVFDKDEAGFNVEHGGTVIDAFKARLNKQFKPQGVEIIDVIIQKISLPQDIQTQMSQKTMVISQNAEQRMQQKYDMLMLQQTEEIKTLKQSHAEQKTELLEEGKCEALKQSLSLQLEHARGDQSLRNISTQMVVDVDMVRAESNLTVKRIQDKTAIEADRIRLEARTEATKKLVEAKGCAQDIKANAKLECAQLSSQADKSLFKAYGKSAPKIRTFNEYTTKKHKLEVENSLASNEKLIVTGSSGGDAANQMLLVDAALAGVKDKENDADRKRVISELSVVSGRAYIHFNADNNGSKLVV